MKKADDGTVVGGAVRLIEMAREIVPTYGAGWYGHAATPSHCMADLLRSHRVVLDLFRFESDAAGLAVPLGTDHVVAIDTAATNADALFTIRHELAHVLADEVQYALFLTSEDTMSFSERRADLFAIVDLTPTRWIEWLRRSYRMSWRSVENTVKQMLQATTDEWTDQRVHDRARLRVLLFREHGI